MKALFALIVLTLLIGCSSLKSALQSSTSTDSPQLDSSKTAPVDNKTVSVDKANADKAKLLTPIHVDTLPPLSATDTSKTTNTLSTTAKPEATTAKPEATTAKPEATTAKPEATTAKPEATTAKPEATTVKEDSTTTSTSIISKTESKTSTDTEPFIPVKVLKVGSRGEEVRALKKRLSELRYDVGKINSFYDKQTRQAVLAFQKYEKLKRTGTYTLETQEALAEATLAKGVHPELGLPRIEVDLTRQVLLFFDDKELNRVIAVSTGTNKKYCDISKKSGRRVCGVAVTPEGKFKIQRRIPGWRESDLGKLYNPLYFYDGYAIHGSPSVPAYNASHGCVRVSIATSLWLYDTVKKDTPVIVFE